MSSPARVLFVVLNYKGWEDTINCVESILKQTYTNYRVMVIENGSGDESPEKLRHLSKNPNIIYREEPVNHGFAGGVNIGIRHALDNNYEYVALLNNDASIDPVWLETLLETITSKGVSAAGGIVLYRDGKTIDSTGDALSIWGLPFPRQRDETYPEAASEGYVFGSTAGATLYRTDLFRDIGLFDKEFFAYFEDTDINFRAQLAGHKTYYQPRAIAYHEHGSTSRKMPGFTVKQSFQNLPIFVIKNTPLALCLPVMSRFFIIYWLLFGRAVLRGQVVYAARGLLGSIKLLPHALRERSYIQKLRKVDIDYLRTVIYPKLPPENQKTLRKILRLES